MAAINLIFKFLTAIYLRLFIDENIFHVFFQWQIHFNFGPPGSDSHFHFFFFYYYFTLQIPNIVSPTLCFVPFRSVFPPWLVNTQSSAPISRKLSLLHLTSKTQRLPNEIHLILMGWAAFITHKPWTQERKSNHFAKSERKALKKLKLITNSKHVQCRYLLTEL